MSDDKDSKLSSTRREETSTEQSQSEELLKAREYLDSAEVMLGELNSKGIIVFVNRKYCEVLGYDRDEIIGKDWFKTFLPKRFRKETYDVFRSLMKGKIERVEYFENPVLTKDGEERIIAWHNTVLTDEAGKITGTLSSGEDITERKRTEEDLRQSRIEAAERVKEMTCLLGVSELLRNLRKPREDAFFEMTEVICQGWQYPDETCVRISVGNEEYVSVGYRETEWKMSANINLDGAQMGVIDVFYTEEKPEADMGPFLKEERKLIQALGRQVAASLKRRAAEEALKEQREWLERTLSSIGDAVIATDTEARVTFMNHVAENLTGWTAQEAMGQDIHEVFNIINEQTREEAKNPVDRVLKEGITVGLSNDTVLISRDGREIPIDDSSAAIRSSDGTTLGVVLVFRDITERKRAERAVQRSEERFRTIFEESPIGIDVFDSDGILIEGNKACLDVFGVSLDDLRGFYLFDDPNVPEEAKKRIRNGETVRYQAPFDFEKVKERGSYETSKSGIAYLNTVITPFGLGEDGSFRGYIVQMQDVTELKQNEEQRRQQHSELEVYASLLRHDLRNDVGVILGNVDLAKMIAGENDSEILETLSSTEAVCERMMNLLKAVSRPADSIEKNIVALVRSVSSQAQGAHAKLTVNVTVNDDAEELTIVGNRLLPMVFENLLRNAAAHAGENPIVDMIISKEGSNVQVLVSDNGPGVPEEVRNRLFHRGVSTSGGGLGLHLSKSIVNAMNGSIELMDTDPGEGSTFKILLPLTV